MPTRLQSLTPLMLILSVWLFSLYLHKPSFQRENFGGDEGVYLTLSKTMGWDLSNYTLKDDPVISQMPHGVYRAPLFFHGPFVPYVLKIGNELRTAQESFFVFANLIMLLFFTHIYIFYKRLDLKLPLIIIGLLSAACAPIILFATTRIFQDAICGMLAACGLIALVEALEKNSKAWAVWCGVLFAATFNTRYSSVMYLPVLFLACVYFIAKTSTLRPFKIDFSRKSILLIVFAIIFSVGLQHYYRTYLIYGTLLPAEYFDLDTSNDWYKMLESRTRLRVVINLFILVPLFFVFAIPATWKQVFMGLREKSWGSFFVLATLLIFIFILAISHMEMRYFTGMTPFFYCAFPWCLSKLKNPLPPLAYGLIGICFLVMLSTGYRDTRYRADVGFDIYPIIYTYFPSIRKYW